MKSVKFVAPWSKYSPGDIAGFEEKQAQRLVDSKAAVHYRVEVEADAPDPGVNAVDPPEAAEVAEAAAPDAQGSVLAEPKPARAARTK